MNESDAKEDCRMYPWSEKRIEWYQRAVAWNGFDAALADAIDLYLSKESAICDLGCGTGYLAMLLAERGYDVTAFDKSEVTIDYLRAEKARRGLDRLTVRKGDWFDLNGGGYWNTVVMTFAGHLDKDMELFLSFARKRLILIIKDDDQSHVQANGVSPMKHVTEEQVKALLDGRKYVSFPLTAQFGQPLKSLQEAREYLETFGADTVSRESAIHRLFATDDADYPLLLPSQKHMQVFIIDKEGTPCTL